MRVAVKGEKAVALGGVVNEIGRAETFGIGDGKNDGTVHEKTDMGVIVENPYRRPLPSLVGEKAGRITRTQDAGPVGWNAAVMAFLDTLGSAEGHRRNG